MVLRRNMFLLTGLAMAAGLTVVIARMPWETFPHSLSTQVLVATSGLGPGTILAWGVGLDAWLAKFRSIDWDASRKEEDR